MLIRTLTLCTLALFSLAALGADKPRKYATPEACFEDYQTAQAAKEIDFEKLIGCMTADMTNLQVGQIAFSLQRAAFVGGADRKPIDALLAKHQLGEVDTFEVLQIATSPGGKGEAWAFQQFGAKVEKKAEFMRDAVAHLKTLAKDKETPKPPRMTLSKVKIDGDTATAQLSDETGKALGSIPFRNVNDSWVICMPEEKKP